MKQKLTQFLTQETLNLEQLRASFRRFNPLDVLGVTHAEIRHSNFIGWLMDPKESHGAGNYFLRKVFEISLNHDHADLVRVHLDSLDKVEIRREWRNLDILVVLKSLKIVMMIENKVHAGKSGDDQLIRYHDVIDEHFPESEWTRHFVYLSPFPRPLEEKELDHGYVNITYLDLIEPIKTLRDKLNLSEEVQQFIDHYLQAINSKILMDTDEILLARQIYIRHKAAIDFIISHKPVINWPKMHDAAWEYLKHRGAAYLTVYGEKKTKDLIRLLPTDVVANFKYPFHSWHTNRETALAIEIFIEERGVRIKFCFGRIWNEPERPWLQSVKTMLHNQMATFDSLKEFKPPKFQNADRGYIAAAHYYLITAEESMLLTEDMYAVKFKEKFEIFESKLLSPWTKEVLAKLAPMANPSTSANTPSTAP